MPSRPHRGPPILQEGRCLGPVAHHALILDNLFLAVPLVWFWPWLCRIHFPLFLSFDLSFSLSSPFRSSTWLICHLQHLLCEKQEMANSRWLFSGSWAVGHREENDTLGYVKRAGFKIKNVSRESIFKTVPFLLSWACRFLLVPTFVFMKQYHCVMSSLFFFVVVVVEATMASSLTRNL